MAPARPGLRVREVRDRTDNFEMINAGSYGTTCARVGCMPSKALIAAANAVPRPDEAAMSSASAEGVDFVPTSRRYFAASVRYGTASFRGC